MDIRRLIKRELKAKGWTTYRLWRAVEDHMSKTAVFNFVGGKNPIASDLLGHILDALDLRIVSTKGAK